MLNIENIEKWINQGLKCYLFLFSAEILVKTTKFMSEYLTPKKKIVKFKSEHYKLSKNFMANTENNI